MRNTSGRPGGSSSRAKQIRKMFWLARQLGWGSDDLHYMIWHWTGKTSIRELDELGLEAVLDCLSGSYRVVNGLADGPTDRQLWKIYDLARQLGWDFMRLAGFCERIGHVSLPEHLNQRTASKVIEGLKALLKKEKARGVQEGR